MNNFVFYSPTEFVFGKDTEGQTGTLAKKYNARKVMIVYGGGSIIRSGLLQRIEESLQQAGVEYVKLGGIQPNPTDPKVYEGIELARKEGVDFMLPVGGGSVIDTAKAIAAGVPYEGDFWDFYIGKAKVKKALKVGVVLTIPAAGSEGSGNTVITNWKVCRNKFACTGITTARFCCDESGIDLYPSPLSDSLWHCRYDGTHYGTLFYQHSRCRNQ